MNWDDIVGQKGVRERLVSQTFGDHLPHALMLAGPSGSGKLGIALALSRLLLCQHPSADGQPCEECPGCRMTAGWAHPDLHFSFPVIKKKSTDQPVSDDYLPAWRKQIGEGHYFSEADWLRRLGGEKEQMQIFVGEADALQQKLSLRSSQGGRRVVVQWLPERMPETTANKLLKLIEEPPSHTHFLLVSDRPDDVLGTIQSRTQRITVPPIAEADIAAALQEPRLGGTLSGNAPEAQRLAHLAQGSMTRALRLQAGEGDEAEYLELFKSLMRTAYGRKIKQMREWVDQVAPLGRERQRQLLQYCQRQIRENFILNFHQPSRLNYLSQDEAAFAQRFAPFVHERNILTITQLLSDAERDISQNVNARMVLLDMIMQLTVALLTKRQ